MPDGAESVQAKDRRMGAGQAEVEPAKEGDNLDDRGELTQFGVGTGADEHLRVILVFAAGLMSLLV